MCIIINLWITFTNYHNWMVVDRIENTVSYFFLPVNKLLFELFQYISEKSLHDNVPCLTDQQ